MVLSTWAARLDAMPAWFSDCARPLDAETIMLAPARTAASSTDAITSSTDVMPLEVRVRFMGLLVLVAGPELGLGRVAVAGAVGVSVAVPVAGRRRARAPR